MGPRSDSAPLILQLLTAPSPTRVPVPPQKEPSFLTRRHLQIPWDSGLCLPPSIASHQRRTRERLTPQRWGPRRVLPYRSQQSRRVAGGGEEAGKALDSPAPPPTPSAVGTAPRRFNTRLYLVLHLLGRPLLLRPSPHHRPPGRGPRVCGARLGRGLGVMAVDAAPGRYTEGSSAPTQLPLFPRAAPRAVRFGHSNTCLLWQVKLFPTTDGPEEEAALPENLLPRPGDQPSPGRT